MSNKHVDVLVIGSGIGGMCAAAYLSHKGYQWFDPLKAAIISGGVYMATVV